MLFLDLFNLKRSLYQANLKRALRKVMNCKTITQRQSTLKSEKRKFAVCCKFFILYQQNKIIISCSANAGTADFYLMSIA